MGTLSDTDSGLPPVPGVVEMSYGLYPGVEYFTSDFAADDYRDWVDESNGDPVPAPLALYLQDSSKPAEFSTQARADEQKTNLKAEAIDQELKLQGALFDSDRPLQQLICSGTIASGWSDDQLYQLVARIQESFFIDRDGLMNWCACLGAVIPDPARLRLLKILGFSNIRFAVVEPSHNKQAGRLQESLDKIGVVIGLARELGFKLVALDLVLKTGCGENCLRQVAGFLAAAGPDRLRLVQGGTDQESADARQQVHTYEDVLSETGYHNIGLDWFVHSDDPWWRAKKSQLLNWSMLGFTSMRSPDVVGVGPGAICSVGHFYGQIEPDPNKYYQALKQGRLPVASGMELENDDLLRREIMAMILAESRIQVTAIEDKWGIRFHQFFAREIEQLRVFKQRGLIDWQGGHIDIRSRGKRELTELCQAFDHRRRIPQLRSVPSTA